MIRYSKLGSVLFVLSGGACALLSCSSDGASTSGGAGATSHAGAGGSAAGAPAVAGAAGLPSGGQAGSISAGGGSGGGSAGNGGASSAGASGATSAGAGGANSAGAGGAGAAVKSAGCGMPAGQTLHAWVEQPKMQVKGVDRQWWVWLPNNYDQSKAYPVLFLFHGCTAAANVVPMQNVTNDQAILVRGAGINPNICWDQSPDGVDMTFFDQMLAAVSAQRCIDTSRVFPVGYSSGSWLVNSLDCRRASKLRASATVSGGVQSNNCSGTVARIFIHDDKDPENNISYSIKERDRLLALNHCSTTTVAEDPAPCVRYQGCDPGLPVVWCQTSGKLHDRQDSLAPGAFWKFFSAL